MATFLQAKNRAISALATAITSTDTSLTVVTGEGAKFPSTFPFHITIEDEILRCTARTTDTLTVVRAQEGTTAAAHSAGVSVELRITAAIVTELQDFGNVHDHSSGQGASPIAVGGVPRIGISKFEWTANKLLKGAGVGVDPIEFDPTLGVWNRSIAARGSTSIATTATWTPESGVYNFGPSTSVTYIELYIAAWQRTRECWSFCISDGVNQRIYNPSTTAAITIHWQRFG